MNRMPCHITDGPQFEDESPDPIDEDDAFESSRDQFIEDEKRDLANEIADSTREALIDMFGEDAAINWSAGWGMQGGEGHTDV